MYGGTVRYQQKKLIWQLISHRFIKSYGGYAENGNFQEQLLLSWPNTTVDTANYPLDPDLHNSDIPPCNNVEDSTGQYKKLEVVVTGQFFDVSCWEMVISN